MVTISVVTICYNNFDELVLTCKSVDEQETHPTEHWIINGSTDTLINDWLENTKQPPYRKWVQITNQHIAGNFSRGIEKATCEYIHLLNSGDSYDSPEVLTRVCAFLRENSSVNWISGRLKTIRGGLMVEVGKPFDRRKLYKGMRSVSHPTWFVKMEVYEKVGLYNTDYRIAMDYDMMCRIADEPYMFIDFPISYFDNTGISSVKYLDSLKEQNKVYESHFGFSIRSRLWQFRLKVLHLLLETNLGKALFRIKKRIGMENF